ncbi:MAG: AI-2E family transporter [Oscillospiraceae bacterium]|nr:AI-2E family transporter [Oscillospiraceae bacterium]
MKIKWNDKYLTVSAYAVITFFVCVMIVLVIYKMPSIIGVIGDFFSSIAAVLWGFVFAYLLNPVMVRIEKLLHKLLDRKTPHPRLCRSASALISVLLGLGVIAALIAIIVPQMFESIQGILNNMNLYMENIYKWINKLLENSPDLAGYANNAFDQLRMSMMNVLNNIGPNLAEWGSRIKAGATGIIGGIGNFVIGFIVAIYFLIDKDKFLAQGRKLFTALLPESPRDHLFSLLNRMNKSVVGFLSGKILDSSIIGVICYICMKVLGLEYALLISVIIGVTNIIPFFGPIIGAVPSGLLLLLADPKHALIFVIMVVLLQQFDGHILGPRILSDSTGLSPFWEMFAIFVGGGMFGFPGMVLGVPVFAVIYDVAKDLVESVLKQKGMSPATSDYYMDGSLDLDAEEAPKRDIVAEIAGRMRRSGAQNGEEKKDEDISE